MGAGAEALSVDEALLMIRIGGAAAFMAGRGRDTCRFQDPGARKAWLEGWDEARDKTIEECEGSA